MERDTKKGRTDDADKRREREGGGVFVSRSLLS